MQYFYFPGLLFLIVSILTNVLKWTHQSRLNLHVASHQKHVKKVQFSNNKCGFNCYFAPVFFNRTNTHSHTLSAIQHGEL